MGQTNAFLYAGTNAGHIYVTFTGGGNNGNQWLNISKGLDGSPIKEIITNPNRGSHEAYAVTNRGVFYIADSVPSAGLLQDAAQDIDKAASALAGCGCR